MIWLRFIFYTIRHGSLFRKPVDFKSLNTIGLNQERKTNSFYTRVRDYLVQTWLLGSIIENIAYVKSLRRIHKNFLFVDVLHLGYLRILKSASTSMIKELLPKIDGKWVGYPLTDIEADQLATRYGCRSLDGGRVGYMLFTIVRNPFHRLVSVYQDIFKKGNTGFVYRTYLFGILKEKMSFKEFVIALSHIPDKLKSPHFASQYSIIKQSTGLNGIRIFRLESEIAQIREFLSNYNIGFEHRNKNTRYNDFRSFYDEETLSLVYKMYCMDVVEFGYGEEYNSLLNYLKLREQLK